MQLEKKILSKKAIVGVIGLGYVGLPLIVNIQKRGFSTYGFDKNEKKILDIKKKISHVSDVTKKDLNNLNKKNFFSLSQIKKINNCDVIIICLPTPLTKNLKPDMSYLQNCCKKILPFLKSHQLLILESTVYPGATEKIFVSQIKKKFDIGKNFYIGYSPERVNPGDTKNSNIHKITKVISGETKICLKYVELIYKKIFNKTYKSKNIVTAEFAKLYENSFRSVNISFANQMKMICDKLKININEVIDTCKTKSFGFTPFYPGPGMGGHCIPIDPLFISWIAHKKSVSSEFIENSRKVNFQITRWIINKIMKYLNQKKNKKILLLGVTYKKNINDTRESPGLKIIEYFKKKKIKIDYYDPYVSKVIINKVYLNSIKNFEYKKLPEYTAVIICANHDKFDYPKILKYSKIIFDTRGVFSNKKNVVNC